ncbi:hypothetical protein AXK59_01180 [Tsukamurella tyrosinosolvens]|nr:hypothetical protein AXK59_01180 [Tsukamurella tyrosinosolvens]
MRYLAGMSNIACFDFEQVGSEPFSEMLEPRSSELTGNLGRIPGADHDGPYGFHSGDDDVWLLSDLAPVSILEGLDLSVGDLFDLDNVPA